MNKIFKLISVAILSLMAVSSCGPTAPQYGLYVSSVDFSKYTAQGFFITEAGSVSFDYKPIGSLEVYEKSGNHKGYDPKGGAPEFEVIKSYDDVYASKEPQKRLKSKWHYASAESCLDAIVAIAKEEGANGIIGLKISPVWSAAGTYIEAYKVSGMMIKK